MPRGTCNVYMIGGMFWCQQELLFEEHGRVAALLEGKFAGSPFEEAVLARVFDDLYNDGTIGKLFAIILTPYEPNLLFRLWNRLACRRRRITREEIARSMTKAECAQVAVDFFFFFTHWTSHFLGAPPSSASILPRRGSPAIRSALRNGSTSLLTALLRRWGASGARRHGRSTT